MASGLFDSPATALGGQEVGSDEHAYRALAGTAIAAGTLALLSPLAFVDWWLLTVPAIGIILGLVAWRDIARRPEALTGVRLAIAATLVASVCLVGGVGFLSWVYAAELPEGFERIHYGLLEPPEGTPAAFVPESALAIDGHDVLLKGYMYPGKQQHGIRQFLLVRDQGDCCFGGNPKITDRVLVHLEDEKGITYTPRQKKIAGRFVVRPTAGRDGIEGGVLYHLEDAFTR